MASKKKRKPPKPRTQKAAQERRKRKARTGKGQGSGPITTEQYRAMWREYQTGVSAAEVARRCGLAHGTVLKYIKVGDPKRDMEALSKRRKRVKVKAREIADHEAVTFRGKVYAQIQDIVARSVDAAEVSMADLEDYRDTWTTVDPKTGKRTFKRGKAGAGRRKRIEGWESTEWARHIKAAKASAELVKTWQEVFGDMIGWGDTEEANEFAGWTVDELERFAATGEIPDRFGGGD